MPRINPQRDSAKNPGKLPITRALDPFLAGIDARLRALREIRDVMARFIQATNLLYSPKSVTFSLEDGISILDRTTRKLDPNLLSSGEKQLLFIFCNSFLIPRASSIFIIDEPELSLNVKWQRQLLDSLKLLTLGSRVQFVVATHSLELLARHRKSTVRLWDKNDAG